jgi:hypothetical protein
MTDTAPTTHSHLISQVVLRQFTDASKQVEVHDKKTGKVELKRPYDVAYTLFETDLISGLEKQWNEDVENQAEKAFNILKNGDLLNYPQHQAVIKNLLALHFVRSDRLLETVKVMQERYAKQILDETLAVYPEHEELIKKTLDRDWPLTTKKAMPELLEENIMKVSKYLEGHDLEIGLAPIGSEFILGDSPAVTLGEEGTLGVAIQDAVNFGMPVTPHHIVAFRTKAETKRYLLLTAADVRAANNKQIICSRVEYYARPPQN